MQSNISACILVLHNYSHLARTLKQLCSADYRAARIQAPKRAFIWGAVGLLVGAAIASALPVTQAENRIFGDASDQLKNRASDVANQGLQVATNAAQDVYQDAVSRAKEHGLGPEVVRETIKDAGEKVRSVVAQASDALEQEHAASTSPSTSHINPKMGD